MDTRLEPEDRTCLSSAAEIIGEARQGRMFILVDDEGRENEGDLIIPAEMATPEAVNFMAKYGRGLICLSMSRDRIEQLGLPLMAQKNGSRHGTAFTVSIEAREGVTTGISAADRARTIATAIDPSATPEDIATPGHVFPLLARDGGVLERAGHTEAAVDVARLAGLQPAGVICEVMNDDGTMARLPDLVQFAQYHGLKIGTIADLISYRRRNESLVRRSLETEFESRHGGTWRMVVYVNTETYAEHVALVKGDIGGDAPILVRVHSLSVLGDVMGEVGSPFGHFGAAMQAIAEEGRGVALLIREPRPDSLSERLRLRQDPDRAVGDKASGGSELRHYGIGAQILHDLGVRRMVLLTQSRKTIIGLDGFGLTLSGLRTFAQPKGNEE